MYYIVKMWFPNGNEVTVTVVARSEGDAINKARKGYHEATKVEVLGSHGA